ncbi:MAG: GTP-binding protein, partial [Acidobacteria bacterium]|nr:GTP-binding protein [Acidobacteriota bacterium]
MTAQPMRTFATQDVRNVAVIGHGGAGKTSLVSAMLFVAGAVNRLGKVTAGNTVTDFDPDETDRQISIGAACAHLEWQKNKVNVLDTPGYGAFVGEAKLALRVADAGLVVVCGVSGVEVQTEKTWAFADEFGLPRLIVVNRLDRERADFARALGSIQERFGRAAVPLQIPIGKEKEFRGLIDLLDSKAYTYAADESGRFTAADVPAEFAELARSERERLVEMVAESDDALMEKFFDAGELGREDLAAGIRRAVLARKLYPVLAAAATANTGTHQILDALTGYLPSPVDRGEATGRNPKQEGETLSRRPARDDPYAAYVFKTIADPFAGRITFFRVYSGAIRGDSQIYNVTRSETEKLGSVHFPQGKDLIAVPEIVAGDIGTVTKLKETKTGDTLADKANPIQFDAVELPPSVVTFAIEPK